MLSELHEKFLTKRGIHLETAKAMGVYSAERGRDGQSCIETNTGNILVFPFIKDGVEVGAKYRGANKVFWQKKDGRKQFFNVDVISDPALVEGKADLVIVEGEMDALSIASIGYPFVVSVPDGAPPPRDKDGKLIDVPQTAHDIDPESDTKFSFLLADWEALSKVKRITIAVDSDEAGKRLAAELVRRLDRIRCSFVVFPEDCKDANDVLMKHGPQALQEVLNRAKPYPVDGLYRASDFPPQSAFNTFSTGWPTLDEFVRPYTGCFMVVGGFPSHGKSSWTMQFAANMAKIHGWHVCVASFEMQIVPYVTNPLMSAFLKKNIKNVGRAERERAEAFLEKRFTFIAPNRADTETDFDIDWLIDKMEVSVIRDGSRMVLIDPFNEIEYTKRPDESMTENIGRSIKKLKAFALQYDVLVCVVVHPTKGASHLDSSELGLYNLAESSHWANKADLGLIVGRIGDPRVDTLTGVYVKKVRHQPDAGKIGDCVLNFDVENRLFVC
jgi:twinkle protein